MAAILVRAQESLTGKPLPTGTSPFIDLGGNVHAPSIVKAYSAKLATGTTASTYAPSNASRVIQSGTMIMVVQSQRDVSRPVVKAAMSEAHHSASSGMTT